MVTRKPVASPSPHPPPQTSQQAANKPPYPTSPIASDDHATRKSELDSQSQRSRSSSVSSNNTWNSGFSDDDQGPEDIEVPTSLRIASQRTGTEQTKQQTNRLPNSLRPGNGLQIKTQQTGQPDQSNPWASEEHKTPGPAHAPLNTHNPRNPYLRMQSTGQQSGYATENSQAAWGTETSASIPPPPMTPPPVPPVELPTVRTPTSAMADMSLDAQLASKPTNHNLPHGLQPALVPQQTGPANIERQHSGVSSINPWDDMDREDQQQEAAHLPTPPHQDAPKAPFSSAPPAYQPPPSGPPAPPPPPPVVQAPQPPQISPPFPAYQAPPAPPAPPAIQAPAPPAPPAVQAFQAPKAPQLPPLALDTGINLMDDEPPPQPPRPSDPAPPPQPPRPMADVPPPQPPRPADIDVSRSGARPSSGAGPETPMTKARRQRNETYQIKQINWFDAAAGPNGRTRRSPIMTQNANGPCPLLALVNALTLSTPEHEQTALIDALSSREQVSLGLLLDAVFEELARRSELHDKELPDVGDLYSFLITLHTGMNVNPQFVAPGTGHVGSAYAEVAFDYSTGKPGVFEETREMLLYSTFDIPLIHGWLPPPDSLSYAAFERCAKTFDEALNIQFREQELEEKLRSGGLTSEEHQLLVDISLIKHFLDNYSTQLTDYGLDVMSRSLRPGQIAILFRNDHFTTLYKDPRSGALTTLVTDAGYSSHDEIVWESLVDVNGAASDLFSGDFRPVGNTTSAGPQPAPSSNNDDFGWETVPSRNSRQETGTISSHTFAPPPGPPPGHVVEEQQPKSSEQEDHDLALAMQLQEEEEDRERQAAAARRRHEDELSRQFLDREANTAQQTSTTTSAPTSPSDRPGNRPAIPPRRSNLGPDRESAPSPSLDAPYMRGSESPDDMPPSYEQAASDRPFRPPGSGPRVSGPRQGDALGALNAITAQNRAQQMNSGLAPNSSYAANSLSSASVNTFATGPGGMGQRRRSSAMRLNGANSPANVRRTHSQTVSGAPAAPIYGDRMGGNYNGNMAGAAPGNRIAEQEKCVMM